MKTILIRTACIILIMLVLTGAVNAFAPYLGYNYGRRLTEVSQLLGYVPDTFYIGQDFNLDAFNTPSDMKFDAEGNLYIVETKYKVTNLQVTVEEIDTKKVYAFTTTEEAESLLSRFK